MWKFSTDVDSDEQAMGPVDIAVGADGKIYLVVALDYDQVRVFRPEGEFLAKFGTLGSGAGQFAKSFGIAVDDEGRIYVADTGRHRVQVFGPILK